MEPTKDQEPQAENPDRGNDQLGARNPTAPTKVNGLPGKQTPQRCKWEQGTETHLGFEKYPAKEAALGFCCSSSSLLKMHAQIVRGKRRRKEENEI
ncbi:hypothetical protein CRG98_024005 [Punica granatum]|uniref:Uncharacterized protein n=1 Tax=Punica granatum TaxID=22663 RepID=A0A2I0JH85_PUNGR|nr:hypothetical protein CRG98_024005 [Punica granatum]